MSAPPIPRYSLTKLESLARDLLRERWPVEALQKVDRALDAKALSLAD